MNYINFLRCRCINPQDISKEKPQSIIMNFQLKTICYLIQPWPYTGLKITNVKRTLYFFSLLLLVLKTNFSKFQEIKLPMSLKTFPSGVMVLKSSNQSEVQWYLFKSSNQSEVQCYLFKSSNQSEVQCYLFKSIKEDTLTRPKIFNVEYEFLKFGRLPMTMNTVSKCGA